MPRAGVSALRRRGRDTQALSLCRELPPGLTLLAPSRWLPVSRTVGDKSLLFKPPSWQWAARTPAHLHEVCVTGGREDAECGVAVADGQKDPDLQATEPGKEALLP